MKYTTRKTNVSLFSASILCMAVVSSFGVSAASTNIDPNGLVKKPGLSTPKVSGTLLKLGASESSLSNSLAQGFNLVSMGAKNFESEQQIAFVVARSTGLHINLKDFYGSEPRLNAYIKQAMKQRKLMVFENTELASEVQLSELPFMAQGEVVLFKPGKGSNTDKIFVYGDGYSTKTMTSASATGGEKNLESGQGIEEGAATIPDNQVNKVEAVKLVNLAGDDLEQALSNVKAKIDELLLEEDIASATGGAIGYSCPSAVRTERLCWAAVVTNSPYIHQSGDAEINIINHYSVAQYRTDQYTTVSVSPHGSANPTMHVDTNDKRAFYLKSFSTTITPTSLDGMNLWYRYPQNQNNQGSITATSGLSYGASLTAAESPSMGGSITYSETNATMMPLWDWETTTTSNGYNATWDFKLSKYQSISDWVDSGIFRNSKLRAVPNISKYGLQYTAEGVWVGDKNKTGWFNVSLSTVTQNQQIYFTTNNWFEWAASTTGWIHTLYPGSYNFNNGWLKVL